MDVTALCRSYELPVQKPTLVETDIDRYYTWSLGDWCNSSVLILWTDSSKAYFVFCVLYFVFWICFVFCILCFVFCVLCFVICVLYFVFCVLCFECVLCLVFCVLCFWLCFVFCVLCIVFCVLNVFCDMWFSTLGPHGPSPQYAFKDRYYMLILKWWL